MTVRLLSQRTYIITAVIGGPRGPRQSTAHGETMTTCEAALALHRRARSVLTRDVSRKKKALTLYEGCLPKATR